MVAFIVSLLMLALLLAPVFPLAKRRKVGTPLSWGEAMAAAAYVFFVLFWVYGVVPHQWLAWSDGDLALQPNKIFVGPDTNWGVLMNAGFAKRFPVNIHAEVLRDVVAAGIYVVALGVNMWLWVWWQNRDKRDAPKPAPVSTYGRPLVRKGS